MEESLNSIKPTYLLWGDGNKYYVCRRVTLMTQSSASGTLLRFPQYCNMISLSRVRTGVSLTAWASRLRKVVLCILESTLTSTPVTQQL